MTKRSLFKFFTGDWFELPLLIRSPGGSNFAQLQNQSNILLLNLLWAFVKNLVKNWENSGNCPSWVPGVLRMPAQLAVQHWIVHFWVLAQLSQVPLSVAQLTQVQGTVEEEWVRRSGGCGMFGRYRKPPLEPTYNILQRATSGKAPPAEDHLQACYTLNIQLILSGLHQPRSEKSRTIDLQKANPSHHQR